MPNLVTLRPGARGTIQLVRKYGEQLMFVRYRYLAPIKTRYKTVELIIDERPWTPRHTPTEFLSLYIEDQEDDIKQCVETHGGKWDKERRLWLLPSYKVHLLGMEHRVVPDHPFPGRRSHAKYSQTTYPKDEKARD